MIFSLSLSKGYAYVSLYFKIDKHSLELRDPTWQRYTEIISNNIEFCLSYFLKSQFLTLVQFLSYFQRKGD